MLRMLDVEYTHTPGHPSAADEAWHWPKRISLAESAQYCVLGLTQTVCGCSMVRKVHVHIPVPPPVIRTYAKYESRYEVLGNLLVA